MLKKTFSTLYNLDFRYITSLSMLFSQDFIFRRSKLSTILFFKCMWCLSVISTSRCMYWTHDETLDYDFVCYCSYFFLFLMDVDFKQAWVCFYIICFVTRVRIRNFEEYGKMCTPMLHMCTQVSYHATSLCIQVW